MAEIEDIFDLQQANGLPPPLLQILLIAREQKIETLVQASLKRSITRTYRVEWVEELLIGLERLNGGVAAVLLSLSSRDGVGIEAVDMLFHAFPQTPILILAEAADEALAIVALQHGAQDYLLNKLLDSDALPYALIKAIARSQFGTNFHGERGVAVVMLNSIGDAILSINDLERVTFLNPVAETMTGWTNEEAEGRPLTEVFRIIDGATRKTVANPLSRAMKEDRTVRLTLNCLLIRRDGFEFAIEDSAAPIHDKAGRISGAVIVFHDVSEARAFSAQITYSAHHDSVTGLPNRLLLSDRIKQSISMARRKDGSIAVMFLDLDHFKQVNDSLGHTVGDKLLRSVSERLVGSIRDADTVSRQGGDEFVILLSELADRHDAALSARRILLAISAPYKIQDSYLHITGSLGISVFPDDGDDADTLIGNADIAMYQAKEDGRNEFRFFKTGMNLRGVNRQSMEAELYLALEKGEFVLHYQPRVDLASGLISGFEAFIRWRHPTMGLLEPSGFITAAEDCGAIVEIGRWVLREACRQAYAWQQAGWPQVPLVVNVSGEEISDAGFMEGVRSVLAETSLVGRYLEFDLTEAIFMKHLELTRSTLPELKDLGVRLAIDNFGTGYSSLSYLRKFPIDVLKIDRSVIDRVTKHAEDALLVSAILDMGRSLKHTIVAGGIETQEQRLFLRKHHCQEGQGYLFSKPLPAKLFARLLKSGIPAVL